MVDRESFSPDQQGHLESCRPEVSHQPASCFWTWPTAYFDWWAWTSNVSFWWNTFVGAYRLQFCTVPSTDHCLPRWKAPSSLSAEILLFPVGLQGPAFPSFAHGALQAWRVPPGLDWPSSFTSPRWDGVYPASRSKTAVQQALGPRWQPHSGPPPRQWPVPTPLSLPAWPQAGGPAPACPHPSVWPLVRAGLQSATILVLSRSGKLRSGGGSRWPLAPALFCRVRRTLAKPQIWLHKELAF